MSAAVPTTDELVDDAIATTGLDDFGPHAWRDALDVLRDSVAHEAAPNAVGEAIFRSWVGERLANRLRVVDWATSHPEVMDAPVVAPLVVAGMLRTGTTILCELLAADPANRPLMKWEALASVPPPTTAALDPSSPEADPRIARTVAEVEATYAMVPKLRSVHYEPGDGPTECVALLGQAFRSQDWLGLFHVPTYVEWYHGCDMAPAYDYHRLALQVLQSQAPGRWSLKAPGHLLALDTLFATYPETRLVVTHRDPRFTVPSSISLSMTSRPDSVCTIDVSRWFPEMWLDNLGLMSDRLCDFRDRHPEVAVFDLHFDDFVADPIAAVHRLYSFFGDTLSTAAEVAMAAHLAASPRGRHGSHRYSLEDYGLDPVTVDRRFARYRHRFGLDREETAR